MCDCFLTGMNISSELSLGSLCIQFIGGSLGSARGLRGVKALAKDDKLS